jgi:hypothetical protein
MHSITDTLRAMTRSTSDATQGFGQLLVAIETQGPPPELFDGTAHTAISDCIAALTRLAVVLHGIRQHVEAAANPNHDKTLN